MSDSRRSSRTRSTVVMLAGTCIYVVVLMFALGALFARQEGLGVGAAAARALHELSLKLPPVLVGYAVGLFLILFALSRKPHTAATPIEAGQAEWRRIRRWTTAGMAPFLVFAAGTMIYHLSTGDWQDIDWLLAVLFAIFSVAVVGNLAHTPSPERLYALGTGDASRVNDERVQQVRGKAAQTTLSIFAAFLVFGGTLYETLVLGAWPILTGSAVVVLVSILAIATAYWNRRI